MQPADAGEGFGSPSVRGRVGSRELKKGGRRSLASIALLFTLLEEEREGIGRESYGDGSSRSGA